MLSNSCSKSSSSRLSGVGCVRFSARENLAAERFYRSGYSAENAEHLARYAAFHDRERGAGMPAQVPAGGYRTVRGCLTGRAEQGNVTKCDTNLGTFSSEYATECATTL